jgi:phosphopantothenoylcysteine decarboxylase/phosphopantothenate--cysteine ligase
MRDKHIVVTAGGTQEPIDPVRHIGNRSSGKMGYALAEAARDRGAAVTLITAPASVPVPVGVEVVRVRTVAEMREAVMAAVSQADALIMAAAVSDFRIANPAESKIKKSGNKITLELVENKDFLLELPDNFIKVGFAAESEDLLTNAKRKLTEKRLDLIAANDITRADSGFDVDTNQVTLIDKIGKVEELPLMSKREVAEKILDRVSEMFKGD